MRDDLVKGKQNPGYDEQALIKDWDDKAKAFIDEDYEKIEVPPCDVKELHGKNGVPDFWFKALS